MTKDWMLQAGYQRLLLQSSAEIRYDSQTYSHILESFTRAQAQTVLEIPSQYNYSPVIIGSSVGGLVLLALIAAALYKLGFFKRQYKEMMENPSEEQAAGAETQDGGGAAQ